MKKFTRLKHAMAMDFTSEDCQPGQSSHHPIIDHPATMQISLFLKNKHTLMGMKKSPW
jgi:hypothetical protein